MSSKQRQRHNPVAELLRTDKVPEQVQRITDLIQGASIPHVTVVVTFDARFEPDLRLSIITSNGEPVNYPFLFQLLEATRQNLLAQERQAIQAAAAEPTISGTHAGLDLERPDENADQIDTPGNPIHPRDDAGAMHG